MQDLDPSTFFNRAALQVFAHPDHKTEAAQVREALDSVSRAGDIAVFSSGTTSALKGYHLTEDALRTNALAVNTFYDLSSRDTWALSLPDYHIGGIAVMKRAELSGSRVIDARGWNPESWLKKISAEKVTVTTIVPTQLYDLVQAGLKAPSHLRLLIVGGDFLSSALQESGRALGWPVVRTYGMSEVGSQLASERLHKAGLEVLSIHDIKTSDDQRLLVRGPALFSHLFRIGSKVEIIPAQDLCDNEGFYLTQDRAEVSGSILRPLGRLDEQLKIAGHLVDLQALREKLSAKLLGHKLFGQAEWLIEEDNRKGKRLVLMVLPTVTSQVVDEIRDTLRPHVIEEVRLVESFNRTSLGKLRKP